MNDITTTITITLKHTRALNEEEFKNLVGNLVEHIQDERGKDPVGDWGFRDITEISPRATHHDENGSIIEPIHGPLSYRIIFNPETEPAA
jgi:hypothetical protein